MTKTIPYNTYGTVTTRASVTIPASNVPYTYEPLKSDLYIASDLTDVAPKPVITSMANYARLNIPNYQNITEISSGHLPEDLNTSIAQDWSNAFANCKNLISLPDPFYDTSNATNMSNMLRYCTNLTTVPNFDTSNVTDMSYMYARCSKIASIPNYNTNNVTNMSGFLSYCYRINTVPNFDTSNVTDMSCMMQYTNLNLAPNFNTTNVTNMYKMFESCNQLVTAPNFDTSNVTDMDSMFSMQANYTLLNKIPILNMSNTRIIRSMYYNAINCRGDLYIESNNVSDAKDLFFSYWYNSSTEGYMNAPYTKNIYCHANSQTYNTIYSNMGNNTYNARWNAYLKTFGSEPIPLLKIADAFTRENGKQDTVNYVFRTPLSNINLCIDSTSGYQVLISGIANVTPYQDLNISVQFNIPSSTPSVSDDPDPEPLSPFGLKIINRDTNEEIYNSSNDHTRFTIYDVNYYLGI